MDWLPEIEDVFGYNDVMKVHMQLDDEEIIDGEVIGEYENIAEASEMTGVHKSSIHRNLTHKLKSAGKTSDGHKIIWEQKYIRIELTQQNENIQALATS